MSAAAHRLREQVRAVEALRVLQEVAVVRQVRPRPVRGAAAPGAAHVPQQHHEERHEPAAPAGGVPIEVTVDRRGPLRARGARQDHPRHRHLRRPRPPRRMGGSEGAAAELLHDGLEAGQVVQAGAQLRPPALGRIPPGGPGGRVVEIDAVVGAGAAELPPPSLQHIGRHQPRDRDRPFRLELVQLRGCQQHARPIAEGRPSQSEVVSSGSSSGTRGSRAAYLPCRNQMVRMPSLFAGITSLSSRSPIMIASEGGNPAWSSIVRKNRSSGFLIPMVPDTSLWRNQRSTPSSSRTSVMLAGAFPARARVYSWASCSRTAAAPGYSSNPRARISGSVIALSR